jgi:glycosyltransferase involved in cell wall biosynthesis
MINMLLLLRVQQMLQVEGGVPLLVSNVGAARELVAAADRASVLFAASAHALAARMLQMLAGGN